jgi:catechol 2,3-dioxygenase-like lactoylglutathione lyase family enzyme
MSSSIHPPSCSRPSLRVHHVAISTDNFARLREFYVETLGLAVVGGFPDRDIVFLDARGMTIELVGEADDDQTDQGHADADPSHRDGFERRGWQHLAWEVADVDAAYDELLARGVAGHAPPEDFPSEAPALRIAFLCDPDGNLLELVQRLAAL